MATSATPPPPPLQSFDDDHQIEFPPLQTHVKAFETAVIAISFVCVIVLLVILLGTDIGNTTRP